MSKETQTNLPLRRGVLVVAAVISIAFLCSIAVSPAAANHGSDKSNYTIVLPDKTDNLPGDQNPQNASITTFAASSAGFKEKAPNGFEKLTYLETGNQEIIYGNCDSPNTAVFGVDRGNNNSGTQVDTDLLQHMKESRFLEHKIEIDFYNESDFGGDPTYLNPEDAIVAKQGAGSQGGPCFTMPTEPGWYQVQGMIRGVTTSGEEVEIFSKSHYIPICEGCHDNATAYEKLGPPPSQQSSTDDGSTDESTSDSTPTSTATATATATPTPESVDGGNEGTATPTPTPEQESGSDEDGGKEADTETPTPESSGGGASNATPTPGSGPGFGPLVALLALLASAFLVRRR
ncbi:MAG: PGF-CTERM protein [Natronomonas sp.]|jgi:PGF-CTERM protein|uniref:PGF-CTERM sorting domain-containing protein n=1 Tax=Natronomonas sp. TaxID=2184060 RepID=UPI003989ED1A